MTRILKHEEYRLNGKNITSEDLARRARDLDILFETFGDEILVLWRAMEKRIDKCRNQVMQCYEDVLKQLDHHLTQEVFDQVLKSRFIKLHKAPKERHALCSYNILQAYQSDLSGKTTSALEQTLEHYGKDLDTGLRQIRRLNARRKKLVRDAQKLVDYLRTVIGDEEFAEAQREWRSEWEIPKPRL